MHTPPYRLPSLRPNKIETETREDGSLLLRSAEPLGPLPPHYGIVVRHWAATKPDDKVMIEHFADGREEHITWSGLCNAMDRATIALSRLDLSRERPAAAICRNAVELAVIQLACIQLGVPLAVITPAYARPGPEAEKLGALLRKLTPGMLLVDDGAAYEGLVTQHLPAACLLTHVDAPLSGSVPFIELVEAGDGAMPPLTAGLDDWAKILFTSGSTGLPKGVITTNRMLLSNQQALRQVHTYLTERPPLIVDWLPWNHCYGGNFNLGAVLYNGGTMVVAHGKPTPEGYGPIESALRRYGPTIHFDVPQGFARLAERLEADAGLRDHFFNRMKALFYAGSTLPEPLWRRMEELGRASTGAAVPMFTGFGTTETTPLHTLASAVSPGPRHVGLPAPGTEVKLLPHEDELFEIRLRGPNVTPGYFRDEQRTAEAFDEEGFYVTGDSVRFVVADEPASGLIFEGRIGLNFKILSGTWVPVDMVRIGAVEYGAPIVRDALVAGLDREYVGLLVFPDLPACRALAGLAEDATPAEVAAHPAVREALTKGINHYNADHPTSSRRVARAILLAEPAEAYESELTAKQYLNQRASLAKRAALVERLYAEPPAEDVLVLG